MLFQNASRIDRQICAVEKFLLQFNQEQVRRRIVGITRSSPFVHAYSLFQQPILAQVRQEIKDKGLVVKPLEPWRKESSRAKGAPESSWSQDTDSKDVVGVDKAAPSSSSASLSARMAQVRDSKKKRKRKAGTGASAAATPGQTTAPVTRTPTPDPSEGGVGGGSAPETEEERLRRQEEEGNLGLPLVGEGQVRAHLSQVEKKSYEEKVQPVRPEDLPAFPFVLRNALFSPKKSALSDEDKFNYMLHLGELPFSSVQNLSEYKVHVLFGHSRANQKWHRDRLGRSRFPTVPVSRQRNDPELQEPDLHPGVQRGIDFEEFSKRVLNLASCLLCRRSSGWATPGWPPTR